MVHTVQSEVKSDADAVVREVAASLDLAYVVRKGVKQLGYVLVEMEQESVEQVLEKCPEANAHDKVQELSEPAIEALGSHIDTV